MPNSASISSSPVVSNAPTARAAENTTPVIVSIARRVRFSSAQIRIAPATRATTAPASGFTRSSNAMPIPGSATCESASAASVIRRMSANEPMSPAATATQSSRTTELAATRRLVVNEEADRLTVDLRKDRRREYLARNPETRVVARQAQYIRGESKHDTQVV